jgi:hypothetical protein
MALGLALLVSLSITAAPGDEPQAKPERVSLEGLATADGLPNGYKVVSKEVRNGDKLLGHRLFITKDGTVSKVIIGIEERPITTRPERVAATKGYVNATAQVLVKAGLKLVKRSIPDLEKANLDKRFVANLVFEKPDGGEVLVQLQIFFGKAAYHVQVVGDNRKDFDALVRWARTVRE